MNFTSKLNLSKLTHAVQTMNGKNGPIEVLILPITANNLYKGEKGIYLDLTHIEIKNPADGQQDTHLIKQNLPKEAYNALSEEEKKQTPILGNTRAQRTNYDVPQENLATIGEDKLPF